MMSLKTVDTLSIFKLNVQRINNNINNNQISSLLIRVKIIFILNVIKHYFLKLVFKIIILY